MALIVKMNLSAGMIVAEMNQGWLRKRIQTTPIVISHYEYPDLQTLKVASMI